MRFVIILAGLTISACMQYPEQVDVGAVCVSADDTGDGDVQVTVRASSLDCSSDHKGASFDCSISADGMTLLVETHFQDGKDPNGGCAPARKASCDVLVPPGTYTVEFDGDAQELEVPGGDEVCLPPDTNPEEW